MQKHYNKTLLVMCREYMSQLRSKAFWLLAVTVPLLLVVCYTIPVVTATRPQPRATVLVVDETGLFVDHLNSSEQIQYQYAGSLGYARQRLLQKSDSIAAVLHILRRETTIPTDANIYYRPGTSNPLLQSDAYTQLNRVLASNIMLDVIGISQQDYNTILNSRISLHTRDIDTGQDPDLPLRKTLALVLSLLMVLAIAIFSTLSTTSVIEERSSRIAEVLLSSVKPFSLLLGKITGTALVALTMLTLWTALTAGGIALVQHRHSDLFEQAHRQNNTLSDPLHTKGTLAWTSATQGDDTAYAPLSIRYLDRINFATIVPLMLLLFMLGYLVYAGPLAAFASAYAGKAIASLHLLPLLVLLALPLLFIGPLMANTTGTLAWVLSLVPFTAPVTLALLLPFGIPTGQALLSIALLVAAVPLSTLLAAAVYRRSLLPNAR